MIKSLLKIRLAGIFNSALQTKKGEQKKLPVGRLILFAVLYLYLVAVFLGFAIAISLSLGAALIPAGASWLYFALFGVATFSVLFILSIFETKSQLFDCKDNELLLSMPIKPRDIVLSRIFTILAVNYAVCAMLMLPFAVVNAVISGDAVSTVGAILSMLLIPLPATALASAVGYAVALISRRLRNSTLITVIFSLAFLGLYFWGYASLMSGLGSANEEELILGLTDSLAFLGVIGEALMFKSFGSVIFVLFSLLVTALAYYYVTRDYLKIATDNRGARKKEYRAEKLKTGTLMTALVKKELSRFTSSSTYLLNGGLGVIFRLAVGVLAIVRGGAVLEVIDLLLLELPGVSRDGLLCAGICAAVITLSSMDMISVSSVSLEGKSLWIIKSMPISARDVLVAKTAAHSVICTPASLVSVIMMLIGLNAPILAYPLAILSAVASSLLFAVFGTVINTAFPKFEFENEAQPIKQSLAVLVVMMSQMLFGFAMIVAALFGSVILSGYLVAVGIALVNILLLIILSVIMVKVSAARFANL